MAQQTRGPGLDSRGNRIALGVAVGFVVQLFAGMLDAGTTERMVVWVVVAAIVYAIATAGR